MSRKKKSEILAISLNDVEQAQTDILQTAQEVLRANIDKSGVLDDDKSFDIKTVNAINSSLNAVSNICRTKLQVARFMTQDQLRGRQGIVKSLGRKLF